MTTLSAGDISFVVTCTILVFLMTPGLAFFYGGMVRKRNVLSIMMQSSPLQRVLGNCDWLWVITKSYTY